MKSFYNLRGFIEGELTDPLKRCVRFGNKGGHADVYLSFAPNGFSNFLHKAYKVSDRVNICICFRWQANHKVQLDDLPSQGKSIFNGFYNFFFANIFIDHIP